jgi:diaminohydroxyphosphoribosylaminopyrimidine deaminase/5-amino-6-(5-phosphoribosylamino)uracil reductase
VKPIALDAALEAALIEARRYIGATAPNPPVGAAALNAAGEVIAVAAHVKAGEGHAEARLLADCRARGILGDVAAMAVTLEPCNHQGRTPPCSEAILSSHIRRVHIGARDPNPHVAGKGAERLRAAGCQVTFTEPFREECAELIEPFVHWATTGLPWVVVKQALDRDGCMIPPPGQKTFTREKSLRLAHELRKRADAIITGSGTVLADNPEFTVRHVLDHPGKRRWLAILDRRGRVPESYLEAARGRGFAVFKLASLEQGLKDLAALGAVEVLVEAGPAVTQACLAASLWNRHVVIRSTPLGDRVEDLRRR